MATLLMVIAPERFRDEELFETRSELEQAGHRTVVASTRLGPCTGSRGGVCECHLTLNAADPNNFDGVVFVGGGGVRLLFADAAALHMAKVMHEQGKVVAAICLAPVILAHAGVLAGKRATVAGTEAATLLQHGATYTGPGVTVDGVIVTANGPKNARRFAQSIHSVLAQRKHVGVPVAAAADGH